MWKLLISRCHAGLDPASMNSESRIAGAVVNAGPLVALSLLGQLDFGCSVAVIEPTLPVSPKTASQRLQHTLFDII